eukprot:SAG31_NODE_144_length_22617_cov_21.520117_14_plen_532_part_00
MDNASSEESSGDEFEDVQTFEPLSSTQLPEVAEVEAEPEPEVKTFVSCGGQEEGVDNSTQQCPMLYPHLPRTACWKMRPGGKQWQKRFVDVDGRSLNVYETQDATDARGSSIPDLSGCVVESTEIQQTHGYELIIFAQNYKYGICSLRFESKDVRDCFHEAFAKISDRSPLTTMAGAALVQHEETSRFQQVHMRVSEHGILRLLDVATATVTRTLVIRTGATVFKANVAKLPQDSRAVFGFQLQAIWADAHDFVFFTMFRNVPASGQCPGCSTSLTRSLNTFCSRCFLCNNCAGMKACAKAEEANHGHIPSAVSRITCTFPSQSERDSWMRIINHYAHITLEEAACLRFTQRASASAPAVLRALSHAPGLGSSTDPELLTAGTVTHQDQTSLPACSKSCVDRITDVVDGERRRRTDAELQAAVHQQQLSENETTLKDMQLQIEAERHSTAAQLCSARSGLPSNFNEADAVFAQGYARYRGTSRLSGSFESAIAASQHTDFAGAVKFFAQSAELHHPNAVRSISAKLLRKCA